MTDSNNNDKKILKKYEELFQSLSSIYNKRQTDVVRNAALSAAIGCSVLNDDPYSKIIWIDKALSLNPPEELKKSLEDERKKAETYMKLEESNPRLFKKTSASNDKQISTFQKSKPPKPKAIEHYKKADDFFQESEFSKALEEYNRAIRIDDNYANAYFNRALVYAIISQYEDARKDVWKVISIEGPQYDSLYLHGLLCEYEDKYTIAEWWYNESLQVNPDNEQTKLRLQKVKGLQKQEFGLEKLDEITLLAIKRTLILPGYNPDKVNSIIRKFQEMINEELYDSIVEIGPILSVRLTMWFKLDVARSVLEEVVKIISMQKENKNTNVEMEIRMAQTYIDYLTFQEQGKINEARNTLEKSLSDLMTYKENKKKVSIFIASVEIIFRINLCTVDIMKNGLTEESIKSIRGILETVQGSTDIHPFAIEIVVTLYLYTLSSDVYDILQRHSTILQPQGKTLFYGLSTLDNPKHLNDFKQNMIELATSSSNRAGIPLLLLLNKLTAYEALERASVESDIYLDFTVAIVKEIPLKKIVEENIGRKRFGASEEPIMKKLISDPRTEDLQIVVSTALLNDSSGWMTLLIYEILNKGDINPLIKATLEWIGYPFDPVFREVEKTYEIWKQNDFTPGIPSFNALRNALIKLVYA